MITKTFGSKWNGSANKVTINASLPLVKRIEKMAQQSKLSINEMIVFLLDGVLPPIKARKSIKFSNEVSSHPEGV